MAPRRQVAVHTDEVDGVGCFRVEVDPTDVGRVVSPGPHDADDLDPEATDAVGAVDFGAVRVPVPARGTVSVEPTANGRLQAVHVSLPEGRLSVSALAAPKSSALWPELATEIVASLREGGARVRSFPGDWGRELHATTGAATSVFVGVDGPRWMVYGVATGPTRDAVALDEQLRRLLRGTVVVRGRSPYPVRTVLPLVVPAHLAPEDDPPAPEPGAQTPPVDAASPADLDDAPTQRRRATPAPEPTRRRPEAGETPAEPALPGRRRAAEPTGDLGTGRRRAPEPADGDRQPAGEPAGRSGADQGSRHRRTLEPAAPAVLPGRRRAPEPTVPTEPAEPAEPATQPLAVLPAGADVTAPGGGDGRPAPGAVPAEPFGPVLPVRAGRHAGPGAGPDRTTPAEDARSTPRHGSTAQHRRDEDLGPDGFHLTPEYDALRLGWTAHTGTAASNRTAAPGPGLALDGAGGGRGPDRDPADGLGSAPVDLPFYDEIAERTAARRPTGRRRRAPEPADDPPASGPERHSEPSTMFSEPLTLFAPADEEPPAGRHRRPG